MKFVNMAAAACDNNNIMIDGLPSSEVYYCTGSMIDSED